MQEIFYTSEMNLLVWELYRGHAQLFGDAILNTDLTEEKTYSRLKFYEQGIRGAYPTMED
jgi:hypothetical protein